MAEETTTTEETTTEETSTEETTTEETTTEETSTEETTERKSTLGGGEETKTEETAEATAVDYAAVELPEGVELDSAALEHFTPQLQAMNVDADGAKELFAGFAKYQGQQIEAQNVEYNKAWDADQATNAAVLPEDMASAKVAMETFFDDDGQAMLAGRLGDVPSVLNALVKIGKAMREDGFVEGKGGANPKAKPAEDVLFPSMNK